MWTMLLTRRVSRNSRGSKIRRSAPAGCRRVHPFLESLENRCLLSLKEFALPTAGVAPLGITAGPDGALWFTERDAGQIGRLATDGTMTEFAALTPGSRPGHITLGPDGALWFTEPGSNQIGRITTDGTITNEFPIPTASSDTRDITTGPDGALWFVEAVGNKIGRITTDGTIDRKSVV